MSEEVPESPPAGNDEKPPTLPPVVDDLPTLHESVPPVQAMMAFKQFAARDPDTNLSLLIGVPLIHTLYDQVRDCFIEEGFEALPDYNNQDLAQRALVIYLAGAWKISVRRLCCGVKNLKVDDAGDKVGSLSNPALPVADPRYEPYVAGVRSRLQGLHPEVELHFACLPPLEIPLLTVSGASDDAAQEAPSEPFSMDRELDSGWIGARSKDPSYAAWVRKHWPDGVRAEKLLNATYYADWMVAFLGATLFPPYTLEGKRMLVRLGFLGATRAVRWTPSKRTRELLEITEQWLLDPVEEHRQALREALQGFSKSRTKDDSELEEAFNYIDQAVTDAVVQSARSAASNDARMIAESAGRAAMGSVMTATFAAQAPAEHTWLEMVSTQAVPDELAEHCSLCVAMRAMAQNPESAFENVSDPKDVK